MAAEAKDKGRTAFTAEQWDDAIKYFSEAIDINPDDVTCLAIRSAAYQKVGNLEGALQDANATITIQPTFVRGYIRKACVLRLMKDYNSEVETYMKGLEHCPGDDSLTKGLSMARRLMASTASRAAREAESGTEAVRATALATRNAALAVMPNTNNKNAAEPKDLATLVSLSKMNMEMQMVKLQAQLNLVTELATMYLPSEQLDFLFELLTTTTACPLTTLTQLAKSMQAACAAETSSTFRPVGEKVQAAVGAALTETTSDGDALTRESLETFIQDIVKTLAEDSTVASSSLGEIVAFIIHQVLFTGVASSIVMGTTTLPTDEGATKATTPAAEENKSRGPEIQSDIVPQKSILNDERMQSLFVLFDKDSDATVDFKEVAIGLYPLTATMGDATKNTAGLLLMIDKNDERVLTYEQFAKLMLAVAGAFGMTFDELADQLTAALANGHGHDIDESVMQQIMVAEEEYAKAAEQRKEEDERKKTMDALSYSRTKRLFELWDANGDGTIDFQELLSGLRRYQKSAMGSQSLQDAERDALMIMGHDKDRNQALDQEEFAYAMANYAEAVQTSLHELIDFMCVVSSQSSTAAEYEVRFEEAMSVQRSRYKPSMGTILDNAEEVEGEEGDEEGEDENW